jgi:AcrR family transcriptional regulator
MNSDERPSRRSRRDERRQETREELVAAAMTVFARAGYHGATMEDIAAEGGYSTGAIYGHFAGKEDLFMAVAELYAVTRAKEFAALNDEAQGIDLPQRVRSFADHWMARFRSDPEFVVLSMEFLVYAWRKPELRAAWADRVAPGRELLGRLLEDAAREQSISLPMPAADLGIVLRELGVGLAMAKLADPDAFADALFGDFVEVLFQSIGAAQERSSQPGI